MELFPASGHVCPLSRVSWPRAALRSAETSLSGGAGHKHPGKVEGLEAKEPGMGGSAFKNIQYTQLDCQVSNAKTFFLTVFLLLLLQRGSSLSALIQNTVLKHPACLTVKYFQHKQHFEAPLYCEALGQTLF